MRTAARFRSVRAIIAFVALLAPASLGAQATAPADASHAGASARRVLTLDDYGEWKRITATDLSPDGRWMSFVYDRNAGEDTLYVKQISVDQGPAMRRFMPRAMGRATPVKKKTSHVHVVLAELQKGRPSAGAKA